MTSVSEQIVTNSNNAALSKAATQTPKQSSSSIASQDFLFLLTEQLKYQDPMNPMDNSEMLAQEAQFATLEQMEALTSSFSKFSTMYQANSLLGQTVEVTVDGETKKGVVDFVDYSDTNGASISVGENMYPLSAITKVYPENSAADIEQEEKHKGFVEEALLFIGTNIGNIAQKLGAYLGNGEDNNTEGGDTGNDTGNDNTTNNDGQ